jgi:hypothetical protein
MKLAHSVATASALALLPFAACSNDAGDGGNAESTAAGDDDDDRAGGSSGAFGVGGIDPGTSGMGGGPQAGSSSSTAGASAAAGGQPGASGSAGAASFGGSGGNGPGLGAGAGGEASATGGNAGRDTGDAGGPPVVDPGGLFFPPHVEVRNVSGEESGFNVIASTLTDTSDGPALFAALRNDREISGCDAAVSFELFDHTGYSLGAWITALYSDQLFRRDDEMDGLVSCVDPGHEALIAVTDLPEDLAIDEVAVALYQLTYFDREILPFGLIPVDEISVRDVSVLSRDGVSAFIGTLENGLDVAIESAAVTIFPVNDVGRPLGVATTTSMTDVAPDGTWEFETTTVVDPGDELLAFPSGRVSFQ